MTAFQNSLDRYLTSEPQDDFTPFCEALEDNLKEVLWEKLEQERGSAWTKNQRAQIDIIEERLFMKGVEPNRAAKIVTRIYLNR